MLYPVMPVYLKSIGFSVLWIGILEGVAEATAGLSKGYFGKLSDNLGRRLPFVQMGYFLSALSKPMMAIWTNAGWVFSARTLDRLGKGIRTGARDALLSAQATASTRGAVFGFHRGMDTLGAAMGPILALAFLYFYPGSYRTLFYLAFLPGIAGVLLTFFVEEKRLSPKKEEIPRAFFGFLKYIPASPLPFRRLVYGLWVFALVNSSDLFLLLLLKERGLSDAAMIGMYIFYNLVYAVFAWPAGILGDRIGLKRIFLIGLAFFFFVYLGMAFAQDIPWFLFLFFLYGLYAACTEGVVKAWIGNLCPREDMATAIGAYEGFRSIGVLAAGVLAGLVWQKFGPAATFLVTAGAVLAVWPYFARLPFKG